MLARSFYLLCLTFEYKREVEQEIEHAAFHLKQHVGVIEYVVGYVECVCVV